MVHMLIGGFVFTALRNLNGLPTDHWNIACCVYYWKVLSVPNDYYTGAFNGPLFHVY